MAWQDYAKKILTGGLPAVLDLGPAASAGQQGDQTRVEKTAPEPTKKDLEPFLQRRVKITENFEVNMAAAVVAGAAIFGLTVALIWRAVK